MNNGSPRRAKNKSKNFRQTTLDSFGPAWKRAAEFADSMTNSMVKKRKKDQSSVITPPILENYEQFRSAKRPAKATEIIPDSFNKARLLDEFEDDFDQDDENDIGKASVNELELDNGDMSSGGTSDGLSDITGDTSNKSVEDSMDIKRLQTVCRVSSVELIEKYKYVNRRYRKR